MSKAQRIVFEGGYLIDPANGREGNFDIFVEQGRIAAIEKQGGFKSLQDVMRIDAAQRWIVPALIDLHVHLREPGYEWKETILTGSRAAALGGYGTVCCMPNTNPVNDVAQVTKFIREKAEAAGLVRVLPIGAVTVGLQGKQLSPLSELRHAGCVAFSDDGEPVFDAGVMRRALEWCAMLDVPICCHEEDKNLSCGGCMNESARSIRMGLKGWPTVAEEVMIARDIELARYTKGRVHICHVSTARGAELIRRAKNDGIRVTGEVTPHHLHLTEDAIDGYDTNAKMSPPLRQQEDCEGLLAALADGTLDAIASDHAPHDRDSKLKEFDQATFGILGLQTNLALTLEFVRTKKLSALRAFAALSSGPAKIMGFEQGSFAVGKPADIALIDAERRFTFESASVASLSKNSPFFGRALQGVTTDLMVAGKFVMQSGEIVEN